MFWKLERTNAETGGHANSKQRAPNLLKCIPFTEPTHYSTVLGQQHKSQTQICLNMGKHSLGQPGVGKAKY